MVSGLTKWRRRSGRLFFTRFLRFFVKLSEICTVIISILKSILSADTLVSQEYLERRLNDHAYLISSVILQCEQQSASEDLRGSLNSAIGFGPWRRQRFEWLIPRFVRYTKEVCHGNEILVSSGTVYRAWQAKILHSRSGNQGSMRRSWCKSSGQRSICIVQNNSAKVTSVFHGSY